MDTQNEKISSSCILSWYGIYIKYCIELNMCVSYDSLVYLISHLKKIYELLSYSFCRETEAKCGLSKMAMYCNSHTVWIGRLNPKHICGYFCLILCGLQWKGKGENPIAQQIEILDYDIRIWDSQALKSFLKSVLPSSRLTVNILRDESNIVSSSQSI